MTRRLVEIVSSDISGLEGAEVVQVPAFDIDLLPGEKAELFRLLEPYLRAGRKGRVAANASGPAASRHTTSKDLTAQRRAVREWANAHGYVVGVKGSIKKEVWEAYESKTPAPGWADPAARREDSAAYHAELAAKIKTPVTERPPATVTKIPAARKSQKAMSEAFRAAESSDTTITGAVNAQKAPRAGKATAPKAGVPRAVKAAVVAGGGLKTAAASKAAPRKTTATAKVSRTR